VRVQTKVDRRRASALLVMKLWTITAACSIALEVYHKAIECRLKLGRMSEMFAPARAASARERGRHRLSYSAPIRSLADHLRRS
jgi:hypothetical protein